MTVTPAYRLAPGARARCYPIPVRSPSGRAWEHRLNLFDLIGGGKQRCYWCGAPIVWALRDQPDSLQVDHLNGDGLDNSDINLVPSCKSCNAARSRGTLWYVLRDNPQADQDEIDWWGPIKEQFACGHEFTPANIYEPGNGHHICLRCHRRKARDHYARTH